MLTPETAAMAPILSKMHSSDDTQSPDRLLPRVLSTQSSLSSLNQLTDDSLIILLSLLPLNNLLDTVHLTCKRWHSLLPVILRRHPFLALTKNYYPDRLASQFFLFPSKRSILPDTFQVHLNEPVKRKQDQSATMPLAVPAPNTDNPSLLILPHDTFLSLPWKVATHFPNLRHLSLVDLNLPLGHLLLLLETYRDRLASLALKHLFIYCRTLDDKSPSDLDDLNGSLLRVLDTLPALRRLALGIMGDALNLRTALGTLLPRLTFLSLDVVKTVDLYETLRRLASGQLRELKLFNLKSIQTFTLAFLFSSKTSFGRSLTSLTLKFPTGLSNEGVTELLQVIVANCTDLRNLDLGIEISTSFDSLLPHLAKLTRLTSLGLTSQNEAFFQASSGALQPPPRLTALRRLTLDVHPNPQMLAILSSVCPNLQKLYLDKKSL